MNTKRSAEPQHPNLGIGSYVPDNSPTGPSQIRPDVEKHVGLNPSPSEGPGAWEHFSRGVKNGLADFVGRLHGETHTPEPDKDHDKGHDR